MPPRELPHLRALADDLAACHGAAELDRGVTVLPIGLSTQLVGDLSPLSAPVPGS